MTADSMLFRGIDDSKRERLLRELGAERRHYAADSYIFHQEEESAGVYILLAGSVEVERISASGRRQMINRFTEPGTVFGEVYTFLEDHPYDFGCVSRKESEVLFLPKTAFDRRNGEIADRLVRNMLAIMSQKAYFLNLKMLVHSAGSIRKKIILYVLHENPEGEGMLPLNREELAAYLAVPRPSLSRELGKMQREGLIRTEGKYVRFDPEVLEEFL